MTAAAKVAPAIRTSRRRPAVMVEPAAKTAVVPPTLWPSLPFTSGRRWLPVWRRTR